MQTAVEQNAKSVKSAERGPFGGSALRQLQAMVHGSVLVHGEPGYEQGSSAHNLAVRQKPAVVVMVESKNDVVAAVNFAREHRLGIAVQSTGHGITTPCDGGVLVNTSRMKGLRIHSRARTATVEAGVQWKDVIPEAYRHGLAPLSGTSPDVGVVGYTLGGGLGWMARRYGYAADSVRSAEIVTADGRLIRASETGNRELLWALRGGTSNFGIVTELEFRLYPVHEVYGGGIFFAFEHAREVIQLFSTWVKIVPEAMTSRLVLLRVPPLPFVPEPIRGRWVVAIQGALIGTADEGDALLRPFRRLTAPLLDTFAMIPYTQIGTIASDPQHAVAAAVGTELLNDISTDPADALLSVVGPKHNDSVVMVEVRHLGGAAAKPSRDSSAGGDRTAAFCLNAIAVFQSEQQEAMADWEVSRIQEAIAPWTTGGVFLNGLSGVRVGHRVQSAYSAEQYERLASIKRKYDPANLFCLNRNIAPAH